MGIIQNITAGINTGDETNSTIKTKLGTDLSNKYDSTNFVAGTNYLTPNGNGSLLTNLTQSQISGLEANANALFASVGSLSQSTTAGNGALLYAKRNRGGGAASNGDSAGGVFYSLYDGSAYTNNAVIRGIATEDQTTSNHGCTFSFEMTKTGQTGRTTVAKFDATTGALYPGADNTYTLGGSGARWSQLWAGTTTISTSDERQKELISSLSSDERFSVLFDKLRPVSYKFKDYTDKIKVISTDKNGDEFEEEIDNPHTFNRLHHGMIAQEVETAMQEANITSNEFAGFIKDYKSGEYGLRYEEFIPMLIQQIQNLKQRVQELEQNYE